MIRPWWIFIVGIHATCDRGWTLIPRAAVAAGKVTTVRWGAVGYIPDDAYPGEVRHRTGVPRTTSPLPPPSPRGGLDISSIFPGISDTP